MRRAYRILPCYAGDVSGVCSALYELGGMVVIHDPSGCNSTYNTHDETRWYDQDSLIFISGFSELDAILGGDDRFVEEVAEAARSLRPRFVALASSPLPYMNGTDFPALARLISRATGIPAFYVPTNGMHDYISGAGRALAEIAERFPRPDLPHEAQAVNLLGLTPLDFAPEGSVSALRERLEAEGWQVRSCWAMGSGLAELEGAGGASVNLVASALGLPAARVLQRRFGIPYVAGIPIGPFAGPLLAALERARSIGENQLPALARPHGPAPVTLIGEPVTMSSLAAAISLRYGCPARVLCPVEADPSLLAGDDRLVRGEEALEALLAEAPHIVADPLYRAVSPAGAQFHPLPHQAFSGRCFRREMRNLMELDW